MHRRQTSGGFTLVEILVAVAIISLLSAALTPLVIKYIEDGRVARTQNDMRTIAGTFTSYFSDTGRWPCDWTGAADATVQFTDYSCLYSNTSNLPNWRGPYIGRSTIDATGKKMIAADAATGKGILDAWGRPFRVYTLAPSNSTPQLTYGIVALVAAGPNGVFDTDSAAASTDTAGADDQLFMVTTRIR